MSAPRFRFLAPMPRLSRDVPKWVADLRRIEDLGFYADLRPGVAGSGGGRAGEVGIITTAVGMSSVLSEDRKGQCSLRLSTGSA